MNACYIILKHKTRFKSNRHLKEFLESLSGQLLQVLYNSYLFYFLQVLSFHHLPAKVLAIPQTFFIYNFRLNCDTQQLRFSSDHLVMSQLNAASLDTLSNLRSKFNLLYLICFFFKIHKLFLSKWYRKVDIYTYI